MFKFITEKDSCADNGKLVQTDRRTSKEFDGTNEANDENK